MTDRSPRTAIKFGERPHLRLVMPKDDCQGEGYVMSALKDSVQQLYPGVDIGKMLKVQERERLIHRAKEAWCNFCAAADAMLACEGIAGDPAEHMAKYINDAKGRRK